MPGADGRSLRLTFPDDGPSPPRVAAPTSDAMTALAASQDPAAGCGPGAAAPASARRPRGRGAAHRAAGRRLACAGRGRDALAQRREDLLGAPGEPRLPGRRPPRGAAHLRRDQRPQHGDRPGGAGLGGRRAARRALGPGPRHHPARQQARVLRRRHDRARRAAERAGRGREAAPQARGRAGAVGRNPRR